MAVQFSQLSIKGVTPEVLAVSLARILRLDSSLGSLPSFARVVDKISHGEAVSENTKRLRNLIGSKVEMKFPLLDLGEHATRFPNAHGVDVSLPNAKFAFRPRGALNMFTADFGPRRPTDLELQFFLQEIAGEPGKRSIRLHEAGQIIGEAEVAA